VYAPKRIETDQQQFIVFFKTLTHKTKLKLIGYHAENNAKTISRWRHATTTTQSNSPSIDADTILTSPSFCHALPDMVLSKH